jgi:hypothetical protein
VWAIPNPRGERRPVGRNCALLSSPLSVVSCRDDSLLPDRIWIKRTMSHYVKLTFSSSTITIDKTSRQRSRERRQRRRSCTSRRASARREGREMVIEIYHYGIPAFWQIHQAPWEAGTVSGCKLHSQDIYHTVVPSMHSPLRLQSNEDATMYVSTERP